MSSKWPKILPELTPEQIAISNDFIEYWHNVLPSYNIIENFNHNFPVRTITKEFITTLEIGAGLGEHLRYENLSEHQTSSYTALELRSNMADKLSSKYPGVRTLVGDIQAENLLPEKHFDRVVAKHVLEHLPNLPKALTEVHRSIKKTGTFQVVIPCEGGLAYQIAREISAKRIFQSRYNQSIIGLLKESI